MSLLLNMVAAPNLGLLLDTWDLVACGGTIESLRKLPAKQIIAVQVADMPAGVAPPDLDEKSRLLPGGENGQIDVAGFLRLLRELGYEGPVTVKPSRSAPAEPPPRRHRQADQRGLGQGLACGRPDPHRPAGAAAARD